MAQDFGQLPRFSQPRSTFALDRSLLGESKNSDLPSRSRNRRRPPILPILGVLLLIGGVVAAVIAAQTNLDLRQWAWGGTRTNVEAIKGQVITLESAAQFAGENKEAAKLFVDLSKTYYNADVINIDIPEFKIVGVVFKQYDVDLDKTFIFGRLENLPLIQAIPRMWISSGDVYFPAGLGQLTTENGVAVGYFLAVIEGDDSPYETLHFSYDEKLDQTAPSASFLSIDFEETPVANSEVQQ
jgi:hypothetical protein